MTERPSSEDEAFDSAEQPSSYFVQSFARGLEVIKSFSADSPVRTLSDVARDTGISRAAVRRLLLTLEDLGYVTSRDGQFQLSPRVLELGYAYVSSLDLVTISNPYLQELSSSLHESCSVAVLDDTDIVFIARIAAKRIMITSQTVGSRLPAHQSSLGRVLLAALPDDEIEALIQRANRQKTTPTTVVDPAELLDRIRQARSQGWALVDQELEVGVRSIAVPVRDRSGVVAALNVTTHSARMTEAELRDVYLPKLQETANAISTALQFR